jgi:hypothetical protein
MKMKKITMKLEWTNARCGYEHGRKGWGIWM